MPAPAEKVCKTETVRAPQDLRIGRIMTYKEAQSAMQRGRRMQAQAIAGFLVTCARRLRGNPDSRAQRVSNAMCTAGR